MTEIGQVGKVAVHRLFPSSLARGPGGGTILDSLRERAVWMTFRKVDSGLRDR